MQNNIPLVSSEIAPLWSGYLGDSMANKVLRYFLHVVKDVEVKAVLEYALSLTEEHLTFKRQLFEAEGFPIPVAFTDEDYNPNAPRLYSDSFMLMYLRQMGLAGVAAYSVAQSSSAREDVRLFFSHNLSTASNLLNITTDLLLRKGLYIRAPKVPHPEAAEFVKKESWLNGFFGDKRALTVSEITQLHINTLTNIIGKTLITGFAQVAKSEEVKQFMIRGIELSSDLVDSFQAFLKDAQLPTPMTYDADVTDSKIAPFSDKLMMFHTVMVTAQGLGNIGLALAASPRRDVAATCVRLMAKIGTFADDGAELMIKNGWFEKMPGAVEREALIQV